MDFSQSILVASPYLQDENFCQTVIWIVEKTPENIMGVILNRPLPKTVQEIWNDLFHKECFRTEPLFIGGPVPGQIIALHTNQLYSEKILIPGVYLSVRKDIVEYLIQNEKGPLKIIFGYAGWKRLQLIEEISNGIWHSLPESLIDPFDNSIKFWDKALQKSTDISLQKLLNIRHFPDNPQEN